MASAKGRSQLEFWRLLATLNVKEDFGLNILITKHKFLKDHALDFVLGFC